MQHAGHCCSECMPDPKTCNEDADCLLAHVEGECCDCPQAISQRQYDADPCWSAVAAPRQTPGNCPSQLCDLLDCADCSPRAAVCVGHRCEPSTGP
jgi:hypothetical protein